jgi:hypothetical protein
MTNDVNVSLISDPPQTGTNCLMTQLRCLSVFVTYVLFKLSRICILPLPPFFGVILFIRYSVYGDDMGCL